jgi:hypothetical protein
MRIGVVGSRRRNSEVDYDKVLFEVNVCAYHYNQDIGLVSGGCGAGADKFAEHISKHYGYDITIHRPDYHKNGRIAPFIRNELIAKESDILIACVAADRKGGTEDTIRKFKKHHPEGKLIIV